MTTEAMSSDGDPRRLLSDVRGLTARVRRDQRLTEIALLVPAVAVLLGIPFDWLGMRVSCLPDGSCTFARRGVLLYWPPALLLTYAVVAFFYVRAARSRGLGARVVPYAITGAALTAVFAAAWVAAALYFPAHPTRFPGWVLLIDHLITPWGVIGLALLVLSRLERNLALLLFTLGYLAAVLALPITVGWGATGPWAMRAGLALPQFVCASLLLLGATGFALAGRRHR